MSVDHYENFPVASVLLPARLREPVEAIYAFARSADDIADEGDWPDAHRLHELARYRGELDRIAGGQVSADPICARLGRSVAAHGLPLSPFYDLLDAFGQDVVKKRYANFEELLDYCRRSANPIGRLLLHLHHADTPENVHRSDAICTALQLINFWQDVAVDWSKGRVYLPANDMARYGVREDGIAAGCCDEAWRGLMDFQIRRSRELMHDGVPLCRELPGRIGWELKLIVAGGLRVLDKIEAAGGDVFRRRPVLTAFDWLRLSARSFLPMPALQAPLARGARHP